MFNQINRENYYRGIITGLATRPVVTVIDAGRGAAETAGQIAGRAAVIGGGVTSGVLSALGLPKLLSMIRDPRSSVINLGVASLGGVIVIVAIIGLVAPRTIKIEGRGRSRGRSRGK